MHSESYSERPEAYTDEAIEEMLRPLPPLDPVDIFGEDDDLPW